MERLKIDYQIRVDKIKRENFLFFFGFWILAYIFLLTMSNLGPYKYIEDILTSSMCNKNLLIGPNQAHFESNSSMGCQFCKDFQRIDAKMFTLKIKLLPSMNSQNLGQFSFPIKVTKYSNKYFFIDNSCTKLNHLIDQSHFPKIDLENQTLSESFSELYWSVEYENRDNQADFFCKSDEFSLNMCTSNNFYENFGENKNLAYYIEIMTNNETSIFNRALFEMIYENPKFYSFLNIFKLLFLASSVLILIYCYCKLRSLEIEDFYTFHKWIFFLLIAQIIKDVPYLVFTDFIVGFSYSFMCLIISEFFYEVALYFFWLSIFEMALQHLNFSNWKTFNFFKVIFIMLLVSLNFAQRYHIWDFQFHLNTLGPIFKIYQLLFYFVDIQALHVTLYIIYAFYFVYLNYSAYSQLLRVDTSNTYTTIILLTTFIFVFNVIMEWRFYLSPLTISVFSYVAFNAVLNIYVYVFSLLYLPQDTKDSKVHRFKEKDNDIIRDVYGEELQEEEMNPVSNKAEDEHKQKVWNQIEEHVKAEEKFDDFDDEIKKEDEDEEEDEDYIYV